MPEITKVIDIMVPANEVFEYVADFRNSLTYMVNFDKFEACGEIAYGAGAEVMAEGRFMSVPIKSRLKIVEFDPPRRFVSQSTEGVESTSTWEFNDLPPFEGVGTEVVFTSNYTVPGGKLFGGLLNGVLVERNIEKQTIQTLVNLKKVLEQRYKAAHSRS